MVGIQTGEANTIKFTDNSYLAINGMAFVLSI